jgi:iron complex transport system ATP-binding protein
MLVVEATHDLNLAATYSSRVVVLHHGRVVADGAPRDSLSAEKIRDVFEVDARMEHDLEGGPWIRYAE